MHQLPHYCSWRCTFQFSLARLLWALCIQDKETQINELKAKLQRQKLELDKFKEQTMALLEERDKELDESEQQVCSYCS